MTKTMGLAGILVLGAVPVFAQWGRQGNNTVSFRPRFQSMDTRGADGRCVIRVRIDDEADVIMNGDTVSIRTYRGNQGRDEGSECTSPMPRGASVQFRGIDGRGDVRLTQAGNGGPAVVHIRDPKGGDEGYTFELRWTGGGYYGNNGPYNNGPYSNNGPYNNGPHNNSGGWWGYGNGGYPNNGANDPYAVNSVARACADMAANELTRRYNVRQRDLSLMGANADPRGRNGRRAEINGDIQDRRTGRVYSYECTVNAANGRVRNVQVYAR